MEAPPSLTPLILKLGLEPEDAALVSRLEEAVRDESFVNEARDPKPKSNKNLAFLGDAVVELAVRDRVLHDNPLAIRDFLSKEADRFVPDEVLAVAARDVGLGPFLRLGNQRRDEDNETVLARAFEAMFGAIYRSRGFPRSKEICLRWVKPIARPD